MGRIAKLSFTARPSTYQLCISIFDAGRGHARSAPILCSTTRHSALRNPYRFSTLSCSFHFIAMHNFCLVGTYIEKLTTGRKTAFNEENSHHFRFSLVQLWQQLADAVVDPTCFYSTSSSTSLMKAIGKFAAQQCAAAVPFRNFVCIIALLSFLVS